MFSMSPQWSPIYLVLRDALREMRKQANMTQTQLAALLHKPQSYVSKIESGERKMDILETRSYCHACGINWLDFLVSLERRLADTAYLPLKR